MWGQESLIIFNPSDLLTFNVSFPVQVTASRYGDVTVINSVLSLYGTPNLNCITLGVNSQVIRGEADLLTEKKDEDQK